MKRYSVLTFCCVRSLSSDMVRGVQSGGRRIELDQASTLGRIENQRPAPLIKHLKSCRTKMPLKSR